MTLQAGKGTSTVERAGSALQSRWYQDPGVTVGNRVVGPSHPVFVIAEIGINHNGDLNIAKELIDVAIDAGCDAVKFQKRTPEVCVPRTQWLVERDTPWGRMTYIEYRERMEITAAQYRLIAEYCRTRGACWFASCWDPDAVAFMEPFDMPCHKVASACLTDHELLRAMRGTRRPIMVSTGMSTLEEVHAAIGVTGTSNVMIAHTNSTYPCPPETLNLRTIETLRRHFPGCPVGYSGHEAGIAPTLAAVALGACFVERHITLDRGMWGSDQAASLEPHELRALVVGIREIESSLGDGVKRRYDSELPAMRKLRRIHSSLTG